MFINGFSVTQYEVMVATGTAAVVNKQPRSCHYTMQGQRDSAGSSMREESHAVPAVKTSAF